MKFFWFALGAMLVLSLPVSADHVNIDGQTGWCLDSLPATVSGDTDASTEAAAGFWTVLAGIQVAVPVENNGQIELRESRSPHGYSFANHPSGECWDSCVIHMYPGHGSDVLAHELGHCLLGAADHEDCDGYRGIMSYCRDGRDGFGTDADADAVMVARWLDCPESGIKTAPRYREAVDCLAARGIVQGYPDGTFGESDPITRGQVALMLWRMLDGD